ncbi:hypothetical protein T4E_1318 [Trichinella pseudospiralis]|uniref:Uncharacterized protein n=1 Tax=Trichinella pseudospiralis TaxID=6337 RepID=A0A0V0Y477_TRIPS|nr:hypothetical protein T4E_1318 [Trichinella pseudospiralis]
MLKGGDILLLVQMKYFKKKNESGLLWFVQCLLFSEQLGTTTANPDGFSMLESSLIISLLNAIGDKLLCKMELRDCS